MQNKLQVQKDFQMMQGDPILLIQAIKQHATSMQDNKYKWSIIHNVSQSLENMKQRNEENLIDYMARFKSVRDVFKAQTGGPIAYPKIVKALADYKDPALKDLCIRAIL